MLKGTLQAVLPLLTRGLFALCILFPATAQAWEGIAVRILDGDTVVVAPYGASHGDISVRLYGIDAPELDQPGGMASREALEGHVRPGDTVKIIPLANDRYSRTVGLLIHGDVILNYEQVRQGYAWVYPQYCKARFCKEWRNAEQTARQAQNGLWGDTSPLPPWEWRHGNASIPNK